jgi:hypothetical protein
MISYNDTWAAILQIEADADSRNEVIKALEALRGELMLANYAGYREARELAEKLAADDPINPDNLLGADA